MLHSRLQVNVRFLSSVDNASARGKRLAEGAFKSRSRGPCFATRCDLPPKSAVARYSKAILGTLDKLARILITTDISALSSSSPPEAVLMYLCLLGLHSLTAEGFAGERHNNQDVPSTSHRRKVQPQGLKGRSSQSFTDPSSLLSSSDHHSLGRTTGPVSCSFLSSTKKDLLVPVAGTAAVAFSTAKSLQIPWKASLKHREEPGHLSQARSSGPHHRQKEDHVVPASEERGLPGLPVLQRRGVHSSNTSTCTTYQPTDLEDTRKGWETHRQLLLKRAEKETAYQQPQPVEVLPVPSHRAIHPSSYTGPKKSSSWDEPPAHYLRDRKTTNGQEMQRQEPQSSEGYNIASLGSAKGSRPTAPLSGAMPHCIPWPSSSPGSSTALDSIRDNAGTKRKRSHFSSSPSSLPDEPQNFRMGASLPARQASRQSKVGLERHPLKQAAGRPIPLQPLSAPEPAAAHKDGASRITVATTGSQLQPQDPPEMEKRVTVSFAAERALQSDAAMCSENLYPALPSEISQQRKEHPNGSSTGQLPESNDRLDVLWVKHLSSFLVVKCSSL